MIKCTVLEYENNNVMGRDRAKWKIMKCSLSNTNNGGDCVSETQYFETKKGHETCQQSSPEKYVLFY